MNRDESNLVRQIQLICCYIRIHNLRLMGCDVVADEFAYLGVLLVPFPSRLGLPAFLLLKILPTLVNDSQIGFEPIQIGQDLFFFSSKHRLLFWYIPIYETRILSHSSKSTPKYLNSFPCRLLFNHRIHLLTSFLHNLFHFLLAVA